MPSSISKAIDWRLRRLFGDTLIDRTTLDMGLRWRNFAGPARIFFGIAGSVGKTTTKDLLLHGLLTESTRRFNKEFANTNGNSWANNL